MKSLHFTWIFLLSLFFSVYAQELTIGIKGGYNNNSIGDVLSFGNSFQIGHPNEIFSPISEQTPQFGAFVKTNFKRLFVRGEINFMSFENRYDFPDQVSYHTFSAFEIPILAGYNIYKPINVYAGPIFTSINNLSLDGAESPIQYKKSKFYFGIGFLLDFKRFGFDIRYQSAKSVENQKVNIDYSDYGVNKAELLSYDQNQIVLTAHINLFRKEENKMNNLFTGLFKSNECKCPYTE